MKQVIFHGGCLGCDMQTLKGLGYCTGCRYFEWDWSLPNLNNKDLERDKHLNKMRELAKSIKNNET